MHSNAPPISLAGQRGLDKGATTALEGLLRLAHSLSRGAVWAGGTLTLASVALVTVDVLMRKTVGRGIGGADELSGYAFAISTAWSLAFVTLQRGHVRVDVLYQRLPLRIAAGLDWLCLVVFSVFCANLTYFAIEVVQSSWMQNSRANSSLGTLLWMPQGLWAAGLAWMCLVLALLLLRASIAMVRGDTHAVLAIAGARSAQEEAHDEAVFNEQIVREARP